MNEGSDPSPEPDSTGTLRRYGAVFAGSFVGLAVLDALLQIPANAGVFLVGAVLCTAGYHHLRARA